MSILYFFFNDKKHCIDFFNKIEVVSPVITKRRFKEIITSISREKQIEEYLLFQLNSFLYYQLSFNNTSTFIELKNKTEEWFSFTLNQLADLDEYYYILFNIKPFDFYDYYSFTSIRKYKLDVDNFLNKWISHKYTLKEWNDNPDFEPLKIASENNIDSNDYQKIATHRYRLYTQKVKQRIKEIEKNSPIEKHVLAKLIYAHIKKALPTDKMTEIDKQYGINVHLTLYESWPLINEKQPIFSDSYDINNKYSFVNHEALFIHTDLMSPSFDIDKESIVPISFNFITKIKEENFQEFYNQLKNDYKIIHKVTNLANFRQIFFGKKVTTKVKLVDEGSMKKIIETMLAREILEAIPSNAYLRVMMKCFHDENGKSLSKNLRSKRCKRSENNINDILKSLVR